VPFWTGSGRRLRRCVAHVGLAALVGLALAGCAGRQPDTAVTEGDRAARHCPTPEPEYGTRPDTPDPSASIAPPVPVGQTSSILGPGVDLEFTVHGYKQPAGAACPDPNHPDNEWAAVDVEVCANAVPDGHGFVAGWSPWSLAYGDGTTAGISGWMFPDFEQPQYPDGKIVPLGQCTRGWITLSAPPGKRPVSVLFQPNGLLFRWTMPPV